MSDIGIHAAHTPVGRTVNACNYLNGGMTRKQVQWDCIMFVDMPYRPFVIQAITLPRAI